MGLWSWLFGHRGSTLSRGLRQPHETSDATAAQMMPSPLVLVRILALAPIAERSARMARRASMAADRAIAEGAAAAAAVMDNVAKCPSTSLQSCLRWR